MDQWNLKAAVFSWNDTLMKFRFDAFVVITWLLLMKFFFDLENAIPTNATNTKYKPHHNNICPFLLYNRQ